MVNKKQPTEVQHLVSEWLEEIKECHPEGKIECYCDNGHEQAKTVCMFCFFTVST